MNFTHQHFTPSYAVRILIVYRLLFTFFCHPLLHSPKEAKIKTTEKFAGMVRFSYLCISN